MGPPAVAPEPPAASDDAAPDPSARRAPLPSSEEEVPVPASALLEESLEMEGFCVLVVPAPAAVRASPLERPARPEDLEAQADSTRARTRTEARPAVRTALRASNSLCTRTLEVLSLCVLFMCGSLLLVKSRARVPCSVYSAGQQTSWRQIHDRPDDGRHLHQRADHLTDQRPPPYRPTSTAPRISGKTTFQPASRRFEKGRTKRLRTGNRSGRLRFVITKDSPALRIVSGDRKRKWRQTA